MALIRKRGGLKLTSERKRDKVEPAQHLGDVFHMHADGWMTDGIRWMDGWMRMYVRDDERGETLTSFKTGPRKNRNIHCLRNLLNTTALSRTSVYSEGEERERKGGGNTLWKKRQNRGRHRR